MTYSKTILAIDDQRDNLTTIKAVLKGKLKNCKILTALSGKEGIEIAKQEQPDTILLDIIMPQMDGFDVCRALKKDEQTKHIPIILITAIKTDPASRVKGLNLGADAFLSKPIDVVELTAQVNVMLRIKGAEDILRSEKEVLKELVSKRTSELRESSTKYMALYDNAPIPYQSLNEDGTFRDVNPAWLRTLGYTRNEIIGNHYTDFLHPDWIVQFESNFKTLKKKGYFRGVQYKMRHKNGTFLDVEFEGCIGYNPDGSFGQTYCVFQDITERKRAEEALLYEKYLLHSLMDNSPDKIYFKDLNSKFIRVNNAQCISFGLDDPQEAVGKDDHDFFAPEHSDNAFQDEQIIINTGQPLIDKEEKTTFKNGTTTWVTSTKLPLRDKNQKIIGTFGISRDITDRKKSEEKLKIALEKAKESDRLKSAFLANMSHEIRTPMNGILGFAGLLKSGDLTGEQQQNYIEIIEKSGARMLNIINDIVDISKIEAGLMKVVKYQTDINQQLADIFDFFKKEAEAKMLEIEYQTGLPDNLAIIQTDKEKIYAVLTNLVKNAIKYSDSGKITIVL